MINECPLGKTTEYKQTYAPDLLYPVPRTLGRDLIDLPEPPPFKGVDIWNAFELSWLNPKGKPEIALAELRVPYSTPNIVESKSLKLYLNSFNQTPFESMEKVKETIKTDLKNTCGGDLEVDLIPPSQFQQQSIGGFSGICLDELDISANVYKVHPEFLKTHASKVEETLYSHLLKSNCLATGQPDWGSLLIRYKGSKIDHEGLLKYIISFRNHAGFAEHCIERMFCDIMQKCRPECLSIYGRYTKRGGLDINPFRSNFEPPPLNRRLPRQ